MARQWFSYLSRQSRGSAGINDSFSLTHVSMAKSNSDVSPYLVPNEWISGRLADFLRLPVPPFALVRKRRAHRGMFASLSFERGDATPDDVNPDACARCLPHLTTGVLVLDILVANNDRHSGNLKVDDPVAPKEFFIFDHDRALFGARRGDGVARLRDLRDRLGVSAGSVSGGNRHCLLDTITTRQHFAEWLNRVETIPDWYIKETCGEVVGVGATREEVNTAVDFLKHRKENLKNIIYDNRQEFSSITDWELFL